MNKYNWLINGEAESQIDKFLEEEHDFEEYCEYIDSFRDVAKQISVLPMIEHYDMIELDCEDLKRGLADVSRKHADRLLERMATDHRNENMSICAEFDHIKERALTETDKSEELMDMISFIENARTLGMIKLNERIKTSFEHLQWMLDIYIFSEDDIELNKTTMMWPKRINPVYDQNDELVEKMKQEGEKQLVERREKLILELNKLKQRVEELDDCGELDMMQTYVQEIRQTQKKLNEAQNEIEWTNNEEKLYKFPVNQYPLVDEITSGIEPFKRLFAVVVAWQKAERKWMDGNFAALDAEQIEGELDDYWRELYKVQKIFNQKLKKLQAEKEERDRERKKKRRQQSEEEEEEVQEEAEIQPPAALLACNKVQDKMREFKEHIPVISIMCNKGLRERHWKQMEELAKFEIQPDAGTSLRKMLRLEIAPYIEQFEQISGAATKEHSLEKNMYKMQDEWNDIVFGLTVYRDTGVNILASVDEIQTLLDDQIVKTQTMRGSPFIKPFEREIKVWEEKLIRIQDTIDEWLKV